MPWSLPQEIVNKLNKQSAEDDCPKVLKSVMNENEKKLQSLNPKLFDAQVIRACNFWNGARFLFPDDMSGFYETAISSAFYHYFRALMLSTNPEIQRGLNKLELMSTSDEERKSLIDKLKKHISDSSFMYLDGSRESLPLLDLPSPKEAIGNYLRKHNPNILVNDGQDSSGVFLDYVRVEIMKNVTPTSEVFPHGISSNILTTNLLMRLQLDRRLKTEDLPVIQLISELSVLKVYLHSLKSEQAADFEKIKASKVMQSHFDKLFSQSIDLLKEQSMSGDPTPEEKEIMKYFNKFGDNSVFDGILTEETKSEIEKYFMEK